MEDRRTRRLVQVFLILVSAGILYYLYPALSPIIRSLISLITPLILGAYAFYIFRPIKHFIDRHFQFAGSFLITFLLFIFSILGLTWLIFDIAIVQVQMIIDGIDLSTLHFDFFDDIKSILDIDALLEQIQAALPETFRVASENLQLIVGQSFLFITQFLLFVMSVFYLLKDEEAFKKYIMKKRWAFSSYIHPSLFRKIDKILESYITGQLIVSMLVGIMALIAYKILGLPYAPLLAAISMVTNLILYVGPFIGAVPAIFVASGVSHDLVVKVLLAIIIVQQIESNFISPLVMGKRLKLHPFIVLLSVLCGITFFGILGALFAVPVLMVSKEAYNQYLQSIGESDKSFVEDDE